MSDVISRLTDLFEDIGKSLLFELKAEARFEILVETCWALWRPFFCIGVLGGWLVTQFVHGVHDFLGSSPSKIVGNLAYALLLLADRNCYE